MTEKQGYVCQFSQCRFQGKARTFSKASLLKQHHLKVHAEKNLRCEKCSKAFAIGYLLQQHVAECGSIFKCQDCNHEFASTRSLRRHQKHANHGNFAHKGSQSIVKDTFDANRLHDRIPVDGAGAITVTPALPVVHVLVPLFIAVPQVVKRRRVTKALRNRGHSRKAKLRPLQPKEVSCVKSVGIQTSSTIDLNEMRESAPTPKQTFCSSASVQTDYSPVCVCASGTSPTEVLANSVATLTETPLRAAGTSASTQTSNLLETRVAPALKQPPALSKTSVQIDVAVGLDEVFDDLQKLFAQTGTQTSWVASVDSSSSRELPTQSFHDDAFNSLASCSKNQSAAKSLPYQHHYQQFQQNAETQTQQPTFSDTYMQTADSHVTQCSLIKTCRSYDWQLAVTAENEVNNHSFSTSITNGSLPCAATVCRGELRSDGVCTKHLESIKEQAQQQEKISRILPQRHSHLVDAAVGDDIDTRLFEHIEVQTTPSESGVQHFGVQADIGVAAFHGDVEGTPLSYLTDTASCQKQVQGWHCCSPSTAARNRGLSSSLELPLVEN